jgi:hypothetical protein
METANIHPWNSISISAGIKRRLYWNLSDICEYYLLYYIYCTCLYSICMYSLVKCADQTLLTRLWGFMQRILGDLRSGKET